MKLIPLDAVVAEIERRKSEHLKRNHLCDDYYVQEDNTILSSLNSLEVKEVDLKEEVERFARECGYSSAATIDFQFAKHFFELGVNASNPLTWKDMRIIDKISEEFINSEDYDKFDEEGYYKEVLKRFKAQKGEKV